jgi:hypothetical protein
MYLLVRSQQVASGLITGVKEHITTKFKILHEMNETNKTEVAEMILWKGKRRNKVLFIYNLLKMFLCWKYWKMLLTIAL